MIKIAPSILSADFANLAEEIRRVSDAAYIHVDVMDGSFVPNLTIGAPVVKAIRPVTEQKLDVHLMIDRPVRYIGDFLAAGADLITVHVEADTPENITAALDAIRTGGARAGLSLKPGTPFEVLLPWLDRLDLLLVMTVEPGFGGQKFMHDQVEKIARAEQLRRDRGYRYEISVDGGIAAGTILPAAAAGATVFVAGSAVFGSEDPNGMVNALAALARASSCREEEAWI